MKITHLTPMVANYRSRTKKTKEVEQLLATVGIKRVISCVFMQKLKREHQFSKIIDNFWTFKEEKKIT